MLHPVVRDAAVAPPMDKPVRQACFIALLVVGLQGRAIKVLGRVAVHGLAAVGAGFAVFEVVEQSVAVLLVVMSVASGGGVFLLAGIQGGVGDGHVVPVVPEALCELFCKCDASVLAGGAGDGGAGGFGECEPVVGCVECLGVGGVLAEPVLDFWVSAVAWT